MEYDGILASEDDILSWIAKKSGRGVYLKTEFSQNVHDI